MTKAVAGHRPLYRRFSRGMTPIRPARTLYGYVVECTCAEFAVRTNENKAYAVKLFADHLTDVRLARELGSEKIQFS